MTEKLVINEELYKDHENRPDLVGTAVDHVNHLFHCNRG